MIKGERREDADKETLRCKGRHMARRSRAQTFGPRSAGGVT